VAGYVALSAACVGGFLLIQSIGEGSVAAPPPPVPVPSVPVPSVPAPAVPAPSAGDVLPRVLIALAAVVFAGRLLGRACERLGQPAVIGEVLAGIALGPSLLGRAWPEATAFLMPPSAVPFLSVIAQLGIVLYMFRVGLELDLDRLRGKAGVAVAVSHAGIAVPFLMGAALALWLYPAYSTGATTFTAFALFLGTAMAITAFPVLARILTDRRMSRTPLGALALTCAAADDATAWCLLAFVVGVARSQVGGAATTVALTVLLVAGFALVVRPLAARWAASCGDGPLSRSAVATAVVALLLSALAGEAVGVHAVFGAFLLGAVIPSGSAAARHLSSRLEDITAVLLLPAFFALTGVKTRIDLLDGAGAWLLCGGIVLVATAGKFGGAFAAARLSGMDARRSAALGALMNTRGLMELVVLEIGVNLGVISPALYSMMVVMALATTATAGPVLSRLSVETDADADAEADADPEVHASHAARTARTAHAVGPSISPSA
jgi:Kef-type K+ transport system membrane component KefB